jgi:hypothetical protein
MRSRWTKTLKVRPHYPLGGVMPSCTTTAFPVKVSQVTLGMSDGLYVHAHRRKALVSSRRSERGST